MDIKKPGPVKAHSFLKLNPVCKKELQSTLRDKVAEDKNDNVKFASNWLGSTHFYCLILLLSCVLMLSYFLILSHSLIIVSFLLPYSIRATKANLHIPFLAPAPSRRRSRSDCCLETGKCSRWPFYPPTHAYVDAVLSWRWHRHWTWHHNYCSWCIDAAL